MSAAHKQQKIAPDAIPATASLTANRQLVEAAMSAHKLTGTERQILRDAWDHDQNWRSEHTLWFKDTADVRAVLRKYGLMKEQT